MAARRVSRPAPGRGRDRRSSVRAMDAARCLRALGLRIGELHPGRRTRSPTSPASASATSRSWRDEPDAAGRPRRRAHRRHRDRAPAPETLLPRAAVPAGAAVLNGAGEMTGLLQVARVGLARDADLPDRDDGGRPRLRRRGRAVVAADPAVGAERRRHPDRRRVRRLLAQRGARRCRSRRPTRPAALADAAAPSGRWPRARSAPARAWSCFGYKGGIGTRRSRVADGRDRRRRSCSRTSAAARRSRVDGVPVGRDCSPMRRRSGAARPAGQLHRGRSPPTRRCVTAQLERVARRAGLGLARTGSVAHHGSGEIFLAFSTARGPGSGGRWRARPLLRGGRRRHRGGRPQRAVERRAGRRPRGPRRRGAPARGGRRPPASP